MGRVPEVQASRNRHRNWRSGLTPKGCRETFGTGLGPMVSQFFDGSPFGDGGPLAFVGLSRGGTLRVGVCPELRTLAANREAGKAVNGETLAALREKLIAIRTLKHVSYFFGRATCCTSVPSRGSVEAWC